MLTFYEEVEFPYYCLYHPSMVGEVIVFENLADFHSEDDTTDKQQEDEDDESEQQDEDDG